MALGYATIAISKVRKRKLKTKNNGPDGDSMEKTNESQEKTKVELTKSEAVNTENVVEKNIQVNKMPQAPTETKKQQPPKCPPPPPPTFMKK